MSEPMRFSLKHHGQLSCVEHCPEGEYVLHSEYARLKAENARLTSELSNITGWGRGLESDLSHARVEISFLKAEVERLNHQVRYWRIEAEVDNARWLRCLEDLEKLRKDSQP